MPPIRNRRGATKQSAPYPKKRKSNNSKPASTPRRASTASSSGRSRASVTRMANLTNVGGTRQVKVLKAGKRLAPSKKGLKKKVSVSKNFKDKVLKSVASKEIVGYFRSIQFADQQCGLFANRQAIQFLPNSGLSLAGSLFNATRILHVAGRLWGNEPAVQDPSFPVVVGPSGNMYNWKNVQIEVKKQFWQFTAKNNTTRTMRVKVYQASPRKSFTNTSFTSGGDPLQLWDHGLDQLNHTGVFKGKYTNPLTGLLVDYPYKEMLGMTPHMSRHVTDHYSLTSTEYLVQPGQDFDWTVTGPRGLIDYSKFIENDVMMPFQKDDIWQFLVVEYDIASSFADAAYTYHIPGSGEDVGHRLIVQCKYACTIVMPEQTGFTEPTSISAGELQPMDLRKPAIVIDDFTPSPNLAGAVDRVDDTLTSIPVV